MSGNGHYRSYINRKFRDDDLYTLGLANKIIEEYEPKGYSLTLRQLYYQMVARAFIPNEARSYDKLGDLISDGRVAGVVSWTAIEDRGRNLRGLRTFKNPGQAIKEARSDFRHDLWKNQPFRPEVWIEKEALAGVIETICNELRVNFFATKGYNSQSEQWRAGRRMARYINRGQQPIVFHLGDHDPSGIDMTRDNRERLSLFAGTPINVQRLALNMDQIQKYGPPPNPAKVTDSRAADYIARFGASSWELDALTPDILHDLIRDAVNRIRDKSLWDEALKAEADDLDTIDTIIEDLGGQTDVEA